MTNLIVKNPHYHAAYELWKFVDAYTELGVSYNVQETEQDFSQPYFEEILALVMADILTLRSNRVKNKVISPKKSKDRVVNPKVVFNLEDETYYDGKFLYDQFPSYKKKRYSPMALTPEQAKEQRLALEENLREERYKKTLVDEDIEKQKNIDIAKEAVERQKKLEAEEKARIKAEKAKEKELAKQKALEERKRKAEEKKALLKEQKELEKTRRMVARQAKNDKKAKLEPLAEKPIEEVLPIEENKPVEEIKPEEKRIEETPVSLPKEEQKENLPQTEPVEENKPVENPLTEVLPEKEETPVVDETPIEPQKEETTNEVVEPSKSVEETPLEEAPHVEEIPTETEPLPLVKEKKARKKKETKPEEKKPAKKPRKKKKPFSEEVNLPLLDETKPVVDIPQEEIKEPTPVVLEETPESPIEEKPIENTPTEPLPEKEETPATSLAETKTEKNPTKAKEKFVKNVPTFRMEKNYVFIKTRKSPKAKKVVLKGKLK